jgi:lipoprotein-releasing system permease protein
LSGGSEGGRFSRPIVRISVIGIALGLAVMILTISIVTGFQKEIREKVIGFGAHIQVSNFDNNESYEYSPVERVQPFIKNIVAEPGIKHVQVFATKAGILKAHGEIQGVVVKGIGKDFDWDFFKKNLVEGKTFTVSDSAPTNDLVISKYIATQLKIKLHDSVPVYFIQQNKQRVRKFSVCGIYETGLGQQFDEVFVLADIAHIQKLNGWEKNQVAGFEILINDFRKIDELTEFVNEEIGVNLHARNIKEQNMQVFSWLNAQDINAVIVIVLMLLVASINMISALLILILERTNMIGILKALGSSNWSVRKIFLYNAAYLIGKGLLWGNIIALALCFLQLKFGIFKLDPESYFVSQIPVNLDIVYVLLLNAGTMLVCLFMLIVPSFIVTRITPVKAIRFS